MTLKLERDLDVLKMYLHAENEVGRLRQSTVSIMDDMDVAITSENMRK